VAGEWQEGFSEPLWVITNLEPEEGLEIYRARMKIEESFKDLKSLLDLEKVMNKKRKQMEKVVALVLLAYAIGLLVGEALRDGMYRGKGSGGSNPHPHSESQEQRGQKWKLYSGLFVLLKQKIQLRQAVIRRLLAEVIDFFRRLVWGNVRSHA
jgi:transposase